MHGGRWIPFTGSFNHLLNTANCEAGLPAALLTASDKFQEPQIPLQPLYSEGRVYSVSLDMKDTGCQSSQHSGFSVPRVQSWTHLSRDLSFTCNPWSKELGDKGRTQLVLKIQLSGPLPPAPPPHPTPSSASGTFHFRRSRQWHWFSPRGSSRRLFPGP